jgi:hypothetical protein
MTKHTPGPWVVDADKDSVMVVGRDGGMAVIISDALLGKPTALDIANARLIAAAPELLEASKMSLSVLSRMAKILEQEPGDDTVVPTLRTAIAKAEGR